MLLKFLLNNQFSHKNRENSLLSDGIMAKRNAYMEEKMDGLGKKKLKIGKKYVIIYSEEELDKLLKLERDVLKLRMKGWVPPKIEVQCRCMCKVCELGKVIINRCNEFNYGISAAKLQKLLVLMHGKHLAIYGVELFPEDVIRWECGVAIKEIEMNFLQHDFSNKTYIPEQIAILNSEKNIIDSVLEESGQLDVFQLNSDPRLNELTQRYPYIKGKKTIIENDEIKRVFTSYG